MLLLINKPKGITSHNVVDTVRRITGLRKVGHAGTLDPNATGLLIVGVGKESTRKLGDISKNTRKEYLAKICLGENRDTDDSEGEIISNFILNEEPSEQRVKKVLLSFKGEIDQIPPIFSAIKSRGKTAYKEARKGRNVILQSRKVYVFLIKLINYSYPEVDLLFMVSSGTYIRALARDIGVKLGTGGYLKELKRTKIGIYSIDQAVKLDELTSENWQRHSL